MAEFVELLVELTGFLGLGQYTKFFLLILTAFVSMGVGMFKYLSKQTQILKSQVELNERFALSHKEQKDIQNRLLEHQEQNTLALKSILEKDSRINEKQFEKITSFFDLSRHEIEDFFFRTMDKQNRITLEDMQIAFENFFEVHKTHKKEDFQHFEYNGMNIAEYFDSCIDEIDYIKSFLVRKATKKETTEVEEFLKHRFSMIKTNLKQWSRDRVGHEDRKIVTPKN